MDVFISYLKAERGRASALAESLGVSPGAISQWGQVPANRVLDVERLTGIKRHNLRPDLYPREEA